MTDRSSDLVQLCRVKAAALAEERKFLDALVVLEHALTRYPDDLALLGEYIAVARRAFDALAPDEQDERLGALEAFVRARAVTVPFESIDTVLRYVSTIADARAALAHEPKEEAGSAPPVADDPASAWDDFATEFDKLMARAAARPTAFRAYDLQHIEGALRPFVLASERLGDREARVREALVRLRAESDRLAREVREEEAASRWDNFFREHRSTVEDAERWMPPSDLSFDRKCTTKLEDIRNVAGALQQVIPQLGDSSAGRKALDFAVRLQKLATKLAKAQQDRYDRFALQQLSKGFDAANEHVKITGDDEPKIARAMIDYFGSIETRQLGPEAAQAYGEIFGVLFQKLDKVSKGADADKPGTKLYVLKQLMSSSRADPTEF